MKTASSVANVKQLSCTAKLMNLLPVRSSIRAMAVCIASVAATEAMPRLQCSLEEVQWTSQRAQRTYDA